MSASACHNGIRLTNATFQTNPRCFINFVGSPEVQQCKTGQPKEAFSTEMAERLLPVFSKQAPFEYRLQIISEQNTRLASRTAKQATPDGTTILQAVSASMSLLPNVYDSIEYDPINDFTPLALLGDYTYVLAVGPAVPQSIQTVDAYVDWVSKNPHFRDVGITLYGSQSHVAGLILAREKEIALRMQTYSHTTAIIDDLLDGGLAATIFVCGQVNARRAEGKIRALTVPAKIAFITGRPSKPSLSKVYRWI
ncbi:tripartite tricarboxylate transporter substrate-binding protein [Pseudomonas sp. JZ134]|uniref:tripartite tricarboxylate transporter substrate-binding protein n=1 Tax=Pseudomonas sp. JZ134 TaxID=2806615 RepID=UPI003D9FB1C5